VNAIQPLKSDIGDKTIFQFFKRVESGQLSQEVRRRTQGGREGGGCYGWIFVRADNEQ